MTEFLYDPDSPAAAQPAGQVDINQVAEAVLAITDYPDFQANWYATNSHSARYRVGRVCVTLSTPYGSNACIQLSERLADDRRDPQLYRDSTYDFVRNDSRGNFKLSRNLVSESYMVPTHRGWHVPAFSDRFKLDNHITWSPLTRHNKYKIFREAEAMWALGVLSVGRAQELLQLAEGFDPTTAKRPERVRR